MKKFIVHIVSILGLFLVVFVVHASYIRHIIKGILLILTLIVFPLHSTAQQSKCTISGHITDAQSAPIAYASVAVYDNTKAVAGTITDDNGKFMLKVPVSTDGYERQ